MWPSVQAPRSRASADQAAAAPLSPTAARQAQPPRHSSGSEGPLPPAQVQAPMGELIGASGPEASLGTWAQASPQPTRKRSNPELAAALEPARRGSSQQQSAAHRGSSSWSDAAPSQVHEDQQNGNSNYSSREAAAPSQSVQPPSSSQQESGSSAGVGPPTGSPQPRSPRQQGHRAAPASAFGQPPSPRAGRLSLESTSTSISLGHLAGTSSKGSSQLSFAQLAGVSSKGSSEGPPSASAAASLTLQPRGSPATPLGSVAEVATPVSPFAFLPTGAGPGSGGNTGGSGGRRGWPQTPSAGGALPALKSGSSEFFQRSSGHSQPGAPLVPSPQAALPVAVPALHGVGLPTRGVNLAPRGSGGTPSSTSRGSDDMLSTRGSWEVNVARWGSGLQPLF